MKKKTYLLVNGIVGGVSAIASAIVAYFNPAYTPAIIASIAIITTAVSEITALFVKEV